MIESANLKRAAAKGLFWSAMERFGAQGAQFVFGIMITRILLPEDFGLVGMILIFMAVGQTLVDSGFGSALIWKEKPTLADYSTVFYFNISFSFLLYVFFFLLAPFIAGFYDEPQLTDLIRVLCLNFIILSFSLIQQTVLQKKVDFKLLTYVNVAGSLIAGFIALYMAIKGYGAWAIVFQILVKSFITSALLWFFNKWRPLMVFSWNSLKELFNYGSKLTVASLIYTIFQYLYFNIIGKLFPVASLGFYTRAVQLQEFPVKTIASVFNRVAFPIFSTIQNDNERLKNAARKTLRTMVFFTFPLLFGLIAVADELIEVVLTEKWLPASDYFKLLCFMGLFFSFQVINGEILKTKGKSGWVLKLEVITKTILLINIFITYRWGITAIIWGQMVVVLVAWVIGSFYVGKLIGYSIWQQIKDVYVYFVLSILMYLLAIIILYFIDNPFISLGLVSVGGASFYLLGAKVMGLDQIQELETLIKGEMGEFKK
ncbi:lipopolysaccharide biosynthesis protein [Draconibacterium sp.]|jgi:O-antigen/teichoic acid export membrane protein